MVKNCFSNSAWFQLEYSDAQAWFGLARKLSLIIKHIVYTVLHMFRQILFWAKNHDNHQNFECCMEMKRKKKPKKYHQAVQHRLKKVIKLQFYSFYPFFEITSDSERTI